MSTEYKMVAADTPKHLSEAVTAHLADGWALHGSPVSALLPHSVPVFCQAVTKEEHPPYMQDTGGPYRESPDAAEARERTSQKVPLKKHSPYDASRMPGIRVRDPDGVQTC